MNGRLGFYIHSDSTTPDKGGCMLIVRTTTDFASRNTAVRMFADRAAMYCYGISDQIEDAVAEHRSYPDTDMPKPWEIVAKTFPDVEVARQELEQFLGEPVTITEFSFLKV